MRLENFFATDEHEALSKPVSVNATALCERLLNGHVNGLIRIGLQANGLRVTDALELTLTGNRPRRGAGAGGVGGGRLGWHTADAGRVNTARRSHESGVVLLEDGDGVVTLAPMEIRTMLFRVGPVDRAFETESKAGAEDKVGG